MKKPALPAALLLLVPLLASCAAGASADAPASTAPPAGDGEVHWSYDGEHGPDDWGDLSEDFAACETGAAQSPVDLPAHTDERSTGHPRITSSPTVGDAVDTGHTIQLVPDGAGSAVEWQGVEFDLAQVHFHLPSEHTVDGAAADAEFHLVHTAEDGRVLVLGVLAQEGGGTNEAWQPFIDGAAAPGSENLPLDVAAMLPTDPTFEEYAGSLTTPPCTEGVRWVIYDEPVELSADQIAVLESAYADNARPVQPLGDRVATKGTLTPR